MIREAHGVTRDLRQMITEARQIINSGVDEALKEQLKVAIVKTADDLGTATKDAMDAAVDRVNRKFDDLAAILTGTDRLSRRQGKPPLEDLIRAAATIEAGAPAAFRRRS